MPPTVRDHDGTEVRLGDRVRTRMFLFFPCEGAVVYVPGVSPEHPEMAFNGLTDVGIRTTDAGMMGVTVHPDTHTIKKSIRFLARGEPTGEASPTDELFEDAEGNPL